MSAVFFIRIIGGVFGGTLGAYVSGKLYDYMYKQTQPLAVTFDDLFQRQIRQQIELAKQSDIYDYDREEGNQLPTESSLSKKTAIEYNPSAVNDALYDNDFEDYYIFIGRENE
ncbi:MAG: hypothetical protein ACOVRN_00910 [Flavobacterium sp.]